MPLPAYYNSNPNLNVTINGINIGEGMQRADMNNALRQMMADIKNWTDTYAVTYPIAIANGGTGSTSAAAAAATIRPNATQNFAVGAVVLLVNDGSGALTITRDTGVALIWASSGADANRALAVGGMAMLLQVATNRWFVSGAQLT